MCRGCLCKVLHQNPTHKCRNFAAKRSPDLAEDKLRHLPSQRNLCQSLEVGTLGTNLSKEKYKHKNAPKAALLDRRKALLALLGVLLPSYRSFPLLNSFIEFVATNATFCALLHRHSTISPA